VSKDYYDECDSSDDDSTDDGSSVKDSNPLVLEIDDNDGGGDDSAAADYSVDRLTCDYVGDNDKSLSDPEIDTVDYPRDRMSAGDRSTCITTVDCSSGSREDIDAGRPPIIAVAEDGDELAERLDEKFERFVDSKTDVSPDNVATNNTAEPAIEQCTDERLYSNDSAEPTFERIENEFVSAEMNYENGELNSDESAKHDDENSNENYNNKNVINNQKNIVDYPRDQMSAGDRSTCITTVDCSSGSREDIDAGRPPIIAVAEDGDELAERLDEKFERFVDSKTDVSPDNVATNNTAEPAIEQCTDERLYSNDSAEPTFERIENEFVSAEMNYENGELNSDESAKHDDENSNENYNNKNVINNQKNIVDYPRDQMSAGDRSTCITTVDCSSGSREDIDAGRPPIIAVAEDGDELAERLDEKFERFVDSKTDVSPDNVATNNTAEPSIEQCTDERLCSNDSAEPTIEHIENEFVSAEMNYANDELNPDESGKLEDENSNENYNNKNVVNNHHRNVGGSIEINNTLKDNNSEKCINPDLNERQGVEVLPLLCSEQIINTSQILCTEKLYTLDIIDHDNAEEESSLTATCKSDLNETKAIPIQLPWLLPPQTKEEFYIKKSSE